MSPGRFHGFLKENMQCVHHLGELLVVKTAFYSLAAKIGLQVLSGVLFQLEALGRLDEVFNAYDAPLGSLSLDLVSSQGLPISSPELDGSVMVRLRIHGILSFVAAMIIGVNYCNLVRLKIKI